MVRTLLAIFAHPDDETFLAGPFLAKCSADGVRVELITATPAVAPASFEIGGPMPAAIHRMSPGGARPAARLPNDGRLDALFCAARILGIARVHLLGYAASPMVPESAPVDAAGAARGRNASGPPAERLRRADVPEVADAIRKILEKTQPEIVLTDSPYGAYGHPDHMLVHEAVSLAFESWRAASGGADHARLYALSFPMPLVRLNVWLMKLRGLPTSHLGIDGDIDLDQAIRSAMPPACSIRVGRFVGARKRASRCYQEEIEAAPLPLRLLERSPTLVQWLLFHRQRLSRIWPITGQEPGDLFAGFDRDD